jgi:glycosyltransferase involved in cell wall biosynthesis
MHLVDVTELFLQELRSRGVEQVWFCGPSSKPGPMRREYLNGVEIIVPPNFGSGFFREVLTRLSYWFFETVHLVRQYRRRPDAILIRDKYWGAVVAYFVARACGSRFLVWLSYPYPEHDTEEAGVTSGWRRYLKLFRAWLGYRMLYRFAMRRADHCFVQSDQMKTDMLARGIPAERMTAVPMAIAKRVFDGFDISTVPADPPVVLYLGTLIAVRKLEILVDAFAIVAAARPDVRFEFVGDGPVPSDRRCLEERVQKAGLAGVVAFTGQLSMSAALDHVMRASVCVSPFRLTPVLRVASPTKFIEYLALAKPTVGNRHPEHSMIAERSNGALIVEWSPQAFADAILWCLDHPEEARAMALRGRRWVQENRTYDLIGNLVFKELERVLAAPRQC